MPDDCLFCAIESGEADSEIVYEDDRSVAFRDINPQAPHHILVIPRKHIASANQIDPENQSLVGHLFNVAREVAQEQGFAEDGYRLVVNCGDDALQQVMHLHLHILAGRKMEWPPG